MPFEAVCNTQANKWLALCMTQTIHAKHFHSSAPLELPSFKILLIYKAWPVIKKLLLVAVPVIKKKECIGTERNILV